MSLDATNVKLTKIGQVLIRPDGFVEVSDFEGQNCSCRDTCVLAMVHAIGVLQRELMADIEVPGGSGCVAETTLPPWAKS